MSDMSLMESPQWYVIHTRPRQEERAAQNLAAWGLESMAPKLLKSSSAVGSKMLFPGYIFSRFDVNNMLHKIKFTRGVLYVVSFAGRPARLEQDVIEAIQNRMDSDQMIQKTPRMGPGDPVLIKNGPLRSFLGVFQRDLPDQKRVEILLDTISYSARVLVPRSDLEFFQQHEDALSVRD